MTLPSTYWRCASLFRLEALPEGRQSKQVVRCDPLDFSSYKTIQYDTYISYSWPKFWEVQMLIEYSFWIFPGKVILSWLRKYFLTIQIMIIFDNFNIFLAKTFYPVFNNTSLWCLLKGRTNFLYWLMKLISKTQSVISEYLFPIGVWNETKMKYLSAAKLFLCLTVMERQ